MTKARAELGDRDLHPMITGSGGMSISKYIHVPFVQKLSPVPVPLAILRRRQMLPVSLAEDAKIIYFENGNVEQRMNGICAGGTGSFIDQMAVF